MNKPKAYIQAVRSREQMIAEYLLPKLEECGEFSEVEAVYDEKLNGPLFNFVQILEKAAVGEGSCFIFQDDSILHRQFKSCIRDVIEKLEDFGMVSLFVPLRGAYLELEKDVNWVENTDHLWQPATGYTKETILGLLEFAKSSEEKKHDDSMVRSYLKKNKKAVWVTVPSLVQHNLNVTSIAGNPKKIRGKVRMTESWWPTIPEGRYKEVKSVKI